MGFTHVEFEGDDQTIVQAIKKEECCILYGTLVEEAKQVLKANGQWSIHFTPREGNRVAHASAKCGLSSVEESV